MFLIILLDVKLATIVSIFVYTYYFQKSINISIEFAAGVFDVLYFCNWHCFCTSIHFAIIGNKSSHKLEVEVEKGFYWTLIFFMKI